MAQPKLTVRSSADPLEIEADQVAVDCAAHTDDDIERALAISDESFGLVRARFGAS